MSSAGDWKYPVRRARTSDVPFIQEVCEPYVQQRILLGKDRVVFYGAVQEFRIAEDGNGNRIGCGALHVMWEDLAEVRTLAVAPEWHGSGVGHTIIERLENDARKLGISRLFCLTFEVDFFTKHGFVPIEEKIVDPEVYAELVRSPDEGVAEFLDLARVKPNTLGNTRMLKTL
ncbi:amino-acid N-acetyltransferase [Microbacteriaceae bacterium VKM Ac-2855]|nr:amino-acid N-acetyltransferase [Microbacteriaceae bacterium VKM Ac-2855]